MELDELKSAWQTLSSHLEERNKLDISALREKSLGKTKKALRPLVFGQILQIVLMGVPCIFLAACLWSTMPAPLSAVIAGVILHAYGVATIISSGVVLGQTRKIDYTGSVLAIQKDMTRLKVLYVRTGLLCGMAWWFMWVVVLMVLAGLVDLDLANRAPLLIGIGILSGALGILLSFGIYRLAKNPRYSGLEKWIDQEITGKSLRVAMKELEETGKFETDK